MDFSYGSAFSVDLPDAYETLILDALQGDASLFTRADEVEHAWAIVDPIIESWADADAPAFLNYEAGTWARPRPMTCWLAKAGNGAGSDRTPELRWTSKADSIVGIEQELARIWSQVDLGVSGREDDGARHIAARTSVMNLVVITRRPEIAERCAATIHALTGRHPSRTLLVTSADPDGPARSMGVSRHTACCHAKTRRRSARR